MIIHNLAVTITARASQNNKLAAAKDPVNFFCLLCYRIHLAKLALFCPQKPVDKLHAE
jgi:hypothetical protein